MINLPDTSTPEGQQAASVLLMKLIGYRLHRSDRMAYITNDPDTFAPSAFIPGETYRGNVPDTQKDAVFSFMCPNLYDKQHMWIAWDVLNWASQCEDRHSDDVMDILWIRYRVQAATLGSYITQRIDLNALIASSHDVAAKHILDGVLMAANVCGQL